MATIYKQGDRGSVVKQIQKVLRVYPDGIWGPMTTESMKQWQHEHGLNPDGLAGPATLAKMGITVVRQALTMKKSRRTITDIVIHCTATSSNLDLSAADIRRMHKRQGWSDIGYHYVVRLDGTIENGRDVNIAGAHVAGHNSHSIGVAYVGGLRDSKAEDTRTEAQKAALLSLLIDLRKLYPYARISGHRDLSPDTNHNGIVDPSEWVKQCPCFDAAYEYRRV